MIHKRQHGISSIESLYSTSYFRCCYLIANSAAICSQQYTPPATRSVTIPQHQTKRPSSFISCCHPTSADVGAHHIRKLKPHKAQLMSSNGYKSSSVTASIPATSKQQNDSRALS
ncbi:hypothetical protein Nepgr_026010 [Nepenthes gracilis]|uniref:Uncharacterized protein n=1 Tax=Nepenthes gracilis TaxID=150966 RepID=A0AAD3T8X2_NEPGR|nr:hypothetical protein Nepgr_026010 [Nepenthes gracilis]